MLSSCVRINGAFYISSAKYRDNRLSMMGPDSTEHGPCSSGIIGGIEHDCAHCFVSDLWPPPDSTWIDRCHLWPPSHVSDDIVRSGCHLVAIGHKLGKHTDNEWRISFSQAEQKLVYRMNHIQFLTYGLLKIFLKEMINNGLHEQEKLLCSYHMKTVINRTQYLTGVQEIYCTDSGSVLNSSLSGCMRGSVPISSYQKTTCF